MNKQDFPLLNNHQELVYLDNAATTQKPLVMIQALNDFYTTSNANVHRGIYQLSENASKQYENARESVAKYIKASSEEVIFTSGTTMSLNLIAKYLVEDQLEPGDAVVISILEHHSNLLPWQEITKRKGAKLIFLPLNNEQSPDLDKLEEILKMENVKVISLAVMSNVMGTRNDFTKVRQIINSLSPKTLIVADAAQEIAHNLIDVNMLGADVLAFSAHKVYGPMGLGVLWVKKELLNKSEPFFKGGGIIEKVTINDAGWAEAPHKFEAGTPPVAEAIAFSATLAYLSVLNWSAVKEHETNLALRLFNGIKEIKGYHLMLKEYSKETIGPVIAFWHENIHAHDLAQLLSYENIALRAGHHCAQILHKDVFNIPASLRASIGMYNSEEDIEKLLSALRTLPVKI